MGPGHCAFKISLEPLPWPYFAVGWAPWSTSVFKNTRAGTSEAVKRAPPSFSLSATALNLDRCGPLDLKPTAAIEWADRTMNSARKIWAVRFQSEECFAFYFACVARPWVSHGAGSYWATWFFFAVGFPIKPICFSFQQKNGINLWKIISFSYKFIFEWNKFL